MSDLFNKLLILRTPKIGPVKYKELLSKFESAAAVVDFLKIDEALKDSVKREMDMANDLGIVYLSDDDSRYPKYLKDIKNHPPIITVRGNLSALGKKTVGMVGTRHASAAGMKFMADLAENFASNDFTVISGMAMGSDSAAHIGALRANGDAQTIAVLAGGADYIWPLENESLYFDIINRGAIISEMPVGFKPNANNFVQRNKIIAGLSEKLILGEADLKSGSMTTAGFSMDIGRKVFAIPSHPTDGRAAGPNRLIKTGQAEFVSGVSDFFETKSEIKKSQPENDLLDKLGTVPTSESVLAQLVKKSVSEIKAMLVVLELQGIVKKQNGGYIKI